jgi:hypothetical protein
VNPLPVFIILSPAIIVAAFVPRYMQLPVQRSKLHLQVVLPTTPPVFALLGEPLLAALQHHTQEQDRELEARAPRATEHLFTGSALSTAERPLHAV